MLSAQPLAGSAQGSTASGMNAWFIEPGRVLERYSAAGSGKTFTLHCVLFHRGQLHFIMGLSLAAAFLASVCLAVWVQRRKAGDRRQ
jgi:hypothetical protein